MDGIAVATSDFIGQPPYKLLVTGESYAGHAAKNENSKNPLDCIKVFTGGHVPNKFDSVIPQEDYEMIDDAESKNTEILTDIKPKHGMYIREVGSDIPKGQVIVESHIRLNPYLISSLAASGLQHATVYKKAVVTIFSTGDELQNAGTVLNTGKIYDSNRIALQLLLRKLPVKIVDLGILPDNKDTIQDAVRKASETSDLIISSGGASVGSADYMTEVIDTLGNLQLWKINIKPGRPVAFGNINNCLFFGLPGNPASTIVTFLTICRPAIFKLCGSTAINDIYSEALLKDRIKRNPGREEFQRGNLSFDGHNLVVSTTGEQESNRLATFREANCLIRISKEQGTIEANTKVQVITLDQLL